MKLDRYGEEIIAVVRASDTAANRDAQACVAPSVSSLDAPWGALAPVLGRAFA